MSAPVGLLPLPETEELGSLSVDERIAIRQMLSIYTAGTIRDILLSPDSLAVIEEVVRAVKKEVKKPFKGYAARGDELTLKLINPRDVKKAGTVLTSWDFSATEGLDWFESDTGDAPITVPEDEGRVYIAFADPIADPVAIAAQIELDGDLYVGQTLNFRLVDADKAKIIKLGVPWILKPRKKYRIQVRYDSTASDRLTPIGVRVAKASTLLTV
jgi:hypothetical protein